MAYLIELDDLRSHLLFATPVIYPVAADTPPPVRSAVAMVAPEPEPPPPCRQQELNLVFDQQAQTD